MTTMVLESIVGVAVLMLLFIIFLVFIACCKPWRFLSRLTSRSHKAGDLHRPLVSDDGNAVLDQSDNPTREYDLEGACYQNERLLQSPRIEGLVYKPRPLSASPQLAPGDSLLVEIVSEPSEDILVGQTVRHQLVKESFHEVEKHDRQDGLKRNLKVVLENGSLKEQSPKVITAPKSCLSLEVISGPSSGLQWSVHSKSGSKLPLTLGRVSPSDLVIKDSEVSGKHAIINWNMDKMKWELVDMGSLNGTLLNSQSVNHLDSSSRQWGRPVELTNGDMITLGTTSNIRVNITLQEERQIPHGIGVASDPMAMRRGGKKLPMEDVCYYQWPLSGFNQFGMFGICDGHGGASAAKSASNILPEKVATILSNSVKRERVLSQRDASDVLRDAFSQTEACLSNQYEGCTATVLLVWADGDKNFFAQCANVGDSACIMHVNDQLVQMTEDHRITSASERLRIQETGEPLRDGEKRLCGLNLARMLGDKFLKQQESRFSSKPFISQVVLIGQASGAFALLASDGFWDVVSAKKASQVVHQMRKRYSAAEENLAEKIATSLLSEARTLRTKDNTSIIFLDFDRISCNIDS